MGEKEEGWKEGEGGKVYGRGKVGGGWGHMRHGTMRTGVR